MENRTKGFKLQSKAEKLEKEGKHQEARNLFLSSAECFAKVGNPDSVYAQEIWRKLGEWEKYADFTKKEAEYNRYNSRVAGVCWENAAKAYEHIGDIQKARDSYRAAAECAENIVGVEKKYVEQGATSDVYHGYIAEAKSLRKKEAELSQNLERRSGKTKDLTSKLTPVIATLGLLSGIFFLQSNITGNAIADFSTKTSSFLGAGLLIVGLIAGFFWVKRK